MRQRIGIFCLIIAIALIVNGITAAPVPAGNRSGDNSGEVVFPVTHETQKPVVQETERTPAATPSPEHTPPPTTPRQTSPPPTTVRATPPPTMPSQTPFLINKPHSTRFR